jgi:hypothetical protein
MEQRIAFIVLVGLLGRGSPDSSASIGAVLRVGRPRFDSRQGQSFFFVAASTPALWLTHLPFHCLPGSLSLGLEDDTVWNFTPRLHYPGERATPGPHCMGLRAGLDAVAEKKFNLPGGNRTHVIHLVAYSLH